MTTPVGPGPGHAQARRTAVAHDDRAIAPCMELISLHAARAETSWPVVHPSSDERDSIVDDRRTARRDGAPGPVGSRRVGGS